MKYKNKQHSYSSNNIIIFPATKNKQLEEALQIFGTNEADIALNKFKKLIDDGCDEAYAFVGAIYEVGGNNVNKDYDKARFYYEQSVERFGATEAYLGLVRIYYYGKGVEKDYCKAFEYCAILSEDADNVYGNFLIGKMYMDGHCVDKDLDKAKEYFKKSWDKGYVFGLTYLGLLEQHIGNNVKGWIYRIKAGFIGYKIARKNISDPSIREI